LITEIMRAKILFHENRINTTDHSEEDIKHSEKRIKELSGSLREMTTLIRNADSSRFDIEAGIKLTVVGDK